MKSHSYGHEEEKREFGFQLEMKPEKEQNGRRKKSEGKGADRIFLPGVQGKELVGGLVSR